MITRVVLAVFLGCWVLADSRAWADAPATCKVTVLARESTLEVPDAIVANDELLIPVARVNEVTGFEVKPQGLCSGETCIPIPTAGEWLSRQGKVEYFNLSRFARHVGQAFAADTANHVWSFTAVPRAQTAPLLSGEAPDFALPDREGKLVKLSSFRGKKVLLLTWASWCGCRFDLVGWQKVYEQLKDQNFEIVAAAQDTGGPKVANVWYDKAKVTFTALVDAKHTVSSLYQMVNVPSGVWIDETGHIVRPAEVAYSKQQHVLGQDIGDDRYAMGVQDWVENGAKSPFVMSPEKLRARLAIRDSKLLLADAEFKLGTYFSEHGQSELASQHWQAAQKLSPDNWNYHRQEWSFDKRKEMTNFLAKVRSLNGRPYYDPAELPETATLVAPDAQK